MADEDLVAGLKQARTAPRHFALVLKGKAPVKAIVQKKILKDSDLLKAKAEAKGTEVVTGVVTMDGGEYVFVSRAPVDVTSVKLRTLLMDGAEMPLKARFEVRETLPEVLDEDAVPQGTVPPPPPPPPSPSNQPPTKPPSETSPPPVPEKTTTGPVDPRKQKLIDGLKAVTPRIKQLLAEQPGLKDELVRAVAEVKTPLDADRIDEATLAMRRLLVLVQSATAGGGEESEQDEREDGENEQVDDDFLERLVAGDDVDEEESEEEPAPVKPELSLEERTPEPITPPSLDAPAIGGRVRWEEAKEEVALNLSRLQQHLRQSSDPGLQRIGEYGFHGITGRLQVGLRVALQEFDSARKKEDREKFRLKALDIIRQYQEFLAKDPLVKKCDENPFQVQVGAREILGAALAGLAKSLEA